MYPKFFAAVILFREAFGVRPRPRVAFGDTGRTLESGAKTPLTPKALRAKSKKMAAVVVQTSAFYAGT
jgi:hypothetical protein